MKNFVLYHAFKNEWRESFHNSLTGAIDYLVAHTVRKCSMPYYKIMHYNADGCSIIAERAHPE